MIGTPAGIGITLGALALFAAVGVHAAMRFGVSDRDRYLTARDSQGALSLALNFFAAVLGAWILFSPPEVGTFGGFLGVFGYALGQAVAVAIFAWVGPRVRDRMPRGSTILEFVGERYGRATQVFVGGVSVLYMFVFLAAELTAIGGVVSLIAGTDPVWPIVAVAAVTAAYIAYGGLPASLATDRWQGWMILGLVGVAAVAVGVEVAEPLDRARAGGLTALTRVGAETLVVLVIAITAANLFHHGFWQRVWAARDRRALVRGTLGGGALIVPVLFLTGAAGAIAAGGGALETPSLAFFDLLGGLPWPVLWVVVALGVALVASSVDTLQNALASLVTFHVGGGRVSMPWARALTVALTIPAAAIAVEGLSVLRLFLVADLLAAAIAFPVFLGLWRRPTAFAAIAGSAAGLLAVVGVGWVEGGALSDGLRLLTLPSGPSLGAFVAAPAASAVVTAGIAMLPLGRAAAVARA